MKQILKLVCVTVLISFMMYSCGTKTLKEAKSVVEAKEAVDEYIKSYQDRYNYLCNQKRNDALKEEFLQLGMNAYSVYGCGAKCINLSYEEQNQVEKYAEDMLDAKPDLKNLATNATINCW